MARILVADDMPGVLAACAATLRDLGHEVDTATNGLDAVCCLRDNHYDLLILDMAMPGLDGRGVLKVRPQPGPPVILITGAGEYRDDPPIGVRHVVLKAFDVPDLLSAVNDVLGPETAAVRRDVTGEGGP